jgi:hypothetical protein
VKKTARLILFEDCPRACPGCCNEYPSLRAQMKPISSMDELAGYEEIVLTGGELLHKPIVTLDFLYDLKDRFPDKRVYMYTAMWSVHLDDMMEIVDGIHYTVHAPAVPKDVHDFETVQGMVTGWDGHARLYVDSSCELKLSIRPSVWDRVEIKPWMVEGECPLPSHEDLLIWKE